MNKILTFIFSCIIVILQSSVFVYAHPLDVSNTTLTLEDNRILGVTYIHPVQLDRILTLSG
jgi:hypothetical protein